MHLVEKLWILLEKFCSNSFREGAARIRIRNDLVQIQLPIRAKSYRSDRIWIHNTGRYGILGQFPFFLLYKLLRIITYGMLLIPLVICEASKYPKTSFNKTALSGDYPVSLVGTRVPYVNPYPVRIPWCYTKILARVEPSHQGECFDVHLRMNKDRLDTLHKGECQKFVGTVNRYQCQSSAHAT